MSSYVIKLIAIITMFCDHSGDAILGHYSILNIIGRIAFPLFCFQIVIGYKHTRNVKKYLLRLFLFGLISQIPFSLFTYSYIGRFDLLNVYFTLALGLLAIYVLDTLPKKYKIIAVVFDIILMAIAELAQTDYGWFGVCLIICIFLFYNDKHAKSDSNNVASGTSANSIPEAVCKTSENAITYFNNNILFAISNRPTSKIIFLLTELFFILSYILIISDNKSCNSLFLSLLIKIRLSNSLMISSNIYIKS